jgi:hypothetical protein
VAGAGVYSVVAGYFDQRNLGELDLRGLVELCIVDLEFERLEILKFWVVSWGFFKVTKVNL